MQACTKHSSWRGRHLSEHKGLAGRSTGMAAAGPTSLPKFPYTPAWPHLQPSEQQPQGHCLQIPMALRAASPKDSSRCSSGTDSGEALASCLCDQERSLPES